MRGEKKRYYISTISKNPLKIKFKLKHQGSASNKKKERICTDLIQAKPHL